MKIGIFGGSFNPPHKIHKEIALKLIHDGYLDKVIYVPTGNKYKKINLIDATYRIEMLNIMINSLDNITVSDYELKSELTYTYQTLDYFKSIYPNDEIYFICGTDNLKEIKSWKEYEYILNNYKLLVINRNHDDTNELIKDINSNNITFVKLSDNIISSTLIRDMIKKKDCNVTKIIDKNVLDYINENGLYKD